jgi:hypothetical protein
MGSSQIEVFFQEILKNQKINFKKKYTQQDRITTNKITEETLKRYFKNSILMTWY